MNKPKNRYRAPHRKSENLKRKLDVAPEPALLDGLMKQARYGGSSKHKEHPHRFGLEPFRGARGDATLCDAHAEFTPADIERASALLRRGLRAGLIGQGGKLIWTIDNSGWIFEATTTNQVQMEYHGYPVLRSEQIAEPVYRRFHAWVRANGDQQERQAAESCRMRYGFDDE